MKQIILILYPGCIFHEVALVLELLAKQFEVVPVSPDGQDHHASNGLTIHVERAYSEVSLDNCAAVLIPGGDPGSVKDNTDIDQMIREAHAKGTLLAAICAGPFLLAKAGVLKGVNFAHGYDAERLEYLKEYFRGAKPSDAPLTKDGNILTAQPQAFIDFAVEVASALGVVDPEELESTKAYYKGALARKGDELG